MATELPADTSENLTATAGAAAPPPQAARPPAVPPPLPAARPALCPPPPLASRATFPPRPAAYPAPSFNAASRPPPPPSTSRVPGWCVPTFAVGLFVAGVMGFAAVRAFRGPVPQRASARAVVTPAVNPPARPVAPVPPALPPVVTTTDPFADPPKAAVVPQPRESASPRRTRPAGGAPAQPGRAAGPASQSAAPRETQPAPAPAAPPPPQDERTVAMRAAQRLQLQAVLAGEGRRSCMINNAVVPQGGQVNGFVVESIADNSVVVRKGRYRFEVNLQK